MYELWGALSKLIVKRNSSTEMAIESNRYKLKYMNEGWTLVEAKHISGIHSLVFEKDNYELSMVWFKDNTENKYILKAEILKTIARYADEDEVIEKMDNLIYEKYIEDGWELTYQDCTLCVLKRDEYLLTLYVEKTGE